MGYNRESVDAEACREASALSRMLDIQGINKAARGRVKTRELRHGLERLEDKRKFHTLFRSAG